MIETAPTAPPPNPYMTFSIMRLREPAPGHSAPAECANPKHKEFARTPEAFVLQASIARAAAGVDLKMEFSTESVRVGGLLAELCG